MIRVSLVLLLIVIFSPVLLSEQASDPYDLELVKFCLKTYSKEFRIGSVQKNVHRLGDAVGIALIKILPANDLADPRVVRQVLPVVRESFAHPELIAIGVNRKPAVTLLLLGHVKRVIQDPALIKEISELEDFVTRAAPHEQP